MKRHGTNNNGDVILLSSRVLRNMERIIKVSPYANKNQNKNSRNKILKAKNFKFYHSFTRSGNFYDWLIEFLKTADMYKWDSDDIITYFSLVLTGPALTFSQSISEKMDNLTNFFVIYAKGIGIESDTPEQRYSN